MCTRTHTTLARTTMSELPLVLEDTREFTSQAGLIRLLFG